MKAPSPTVSGKSESHGKRVFLLGATGSIGRATLAALTARGHEVVAFVRPRPDGTPPAPPSGAELRLGEVSDPGSLDRDGFRGERFDALVSCLASRRGTPREAWAIDHRAQVAALKAAKAAGIQQAVLLSAICVQRPRLAFQEAKLAAEQAVIDSGLTYSIVRPTAFFKSLSGQIDRVRQGKPFLLFGDGRGTACKPISDRDLAAFLADCLERPDLQNRILPVGGPGPAITPREQGEALFRLTGQPTRFKQVPLGLMGGIVGTLSVLGRLSPALAEKAELARIGQYYATESMLLWDEAAGRYDADATPETGSDRLFDHYQRVLAGEAENERVDVAVF